MKSVSKTFLTGLVTILPLLATLYILFWLSTAAESILGKAIRFVLPDRIYLPGMGIVMGVILVFLVGLFMNTLIVRKIFEWGENLLFRIPFIKSVYGSFRDFLQFVSDSGKKGGVREQVVMVNLGDTKMEMMGIVTRRDFSGLPEGVGGEEDVAVYLPMSYQIGGHTVIVPKSSVRPVETSREQAMKFILTAGMKSESLDEKG